MNFFKGPFYLFCAFSLAGTSVISARFVSGKLGTFTITSVSLIFALLFLVPICRKKIFVTLRFLKVKDWLLIFIQAFCGIFLFRMFLLNGLNYTSSGEVGILTGATPAVTTILAVMLLKEAPAKRKLLGIFSTVAGILLVQGFLTSDNGFSYKHFWGNMLVLCSASCESLFNIFSRIFAVKKAEAENSQTNPIVQTTIVSTIALLLCLIPAGFEHAADSLYQIGLKEWLALVWYGVFVTALAFICWYSGINRCSAFTAAAFSGMMPLTSLILSMLILGEHVGILQWSGGILIMLGMVLISSGDTKLGFRLFGKVGNSSG